MVYSFSEEVAVQGDPPEFTSDESNVSEKILQRRRNRDFRCS